MREARNNPEAYAAPYTARIGGKPLPSPATLEAAWHQQDVEELAEERGISPEAAAAWLKDNPRA